MGKAVSLSIVFIFIYPIFLKFLPLPFDRVLQAVGLLVLLLNPQDLIKILKSAPFWRFMVLTLGLLILAIIAQLQIIGAYDFYFIKTVIDTFLSVFSAYLVFWALRKLNRSIDISYVLYFIVLAGLLQTVISTIFFVNTSYFETYISFLKEETNEGLFSRLSTLNKRFIGVGSQFFSGVIKYGFAFLSILILPFLKRSKFTSNKIIYWSCVLLIVVGGVLTGRTFFVALLLGVLMVSILKAKSLFSFVSANVKVFFMVIIALPIIYFIASLLLDGERLDTINDYVFELFINFFSEGELSTTSSDATLAMYKFPEQISTWIFGDGKMFDSGGYYMRTDVGFIRLIFYFGLPSTFFFVYVLYKYFKILSSFLKNKALNVFIFFSALWVFILNFKGLAFESHYFVLFLIVLILTTNKKQPFPENPI